MPLERVAQYLVGLVEPVSLERVDYGVEHQADPGKRLHRSVVEEEREPAALVLLGRDQLIRETCALRLADLRLGQQPRVLDRSRREVGQQCRAGQLLAVELL